MNMQGSINSLVMNLSESLDFLVYLTVASELDNKKACRCKTYESVMTSVFITGSFWLPWVFGTCVFLCKLILIGYRVNSVPGSSNPSVMNSRVFTTPQEWIHQGVSTPRWLPQYTGVLIINTNNSKNIQQNSKSFPGMSTKWGQEKLLDKKNQSQLVSSHCPFHNQSKLPINCNALKAGGGTADGSDNLTWTVLLPVELLYFPRYGAGLGPCHPGLQDFRPEPGGSNHLLVTNSRVGQNLT
jgi:hypothetical protein